MRTYAAELDDEGVVIRGIVGTADWATENLGGTWVEVTHKFGPGWRLVDGTLAPPQPYPSWAWDGETWQPPVAQPDGGMWSWDEDAGQWVEVDADEI